MKDRSVAGVGSVSEGVVGPIKLETVRISFTAVNKGMELVAARIACSTLVNEVRVGVTGLSSLGLIVEIECTAVIQ